jgi:periplasmic protein TonB
MKRIKKRVPGFDEIIFENRNKDYGAYDIRRHYVPATFWSLFGATLMFSALVIGLSMLTEKDAGAGRTDLIYVVVKTDPAINNPDKIKSDEPEKPADNPVIRIIGPPVITNDTSAVTDMPTNDLMLDSVKNKPVTVKDSIKYDPDPVFEPDPEPPIIIEEMPVFPGGLSGLTKFINENIKYPDEAASNGVQGRVVLRFVVGKDGSISRIQVIKGVHPVLDQEAIRVISMMPRWKPGKQNGMPAAVWFNVPVSFRLKEN